MRILFHTYDFAMQRMGGGERVMLSLKRALEEKNCSVDFFNSWQHDPKKYHCYHYFSCRQWEYWSYFRKDYPNLAFVLTPTIAIPPKQKNPIKKIVQISTEGRFRKALQVPDHVLPATVYEARYIQNNLDVPSLKISLLRNGIGDWVVTGEKEIFYKKIGRTPQEKIFLSVGRFEPTKNQKQLILAFQNIPNFLCVFIGGGDFYNSQYLLECQSLAEKISRGSKSREFIFLPSIDQNDPLLAAAYAAADIYVQPSIYETFAMAALEAYAAGCTLLLTENIADKEIFAGGAAYFDPYSIASLEKAVFVSMQAQRQSKPRNEILKKFHWSQIAEDLLQVYRRL